MNSIALEYISSSQKYHQLSDLLKLDWAMLLDSGNIPESSNRENELIYRRFDIFVCQPTLRLTYSNQRLTIEDNTANESLRKTEVIDSSPLETMREIAKEYSSNHTNFEEELSTANLPFNGGLLGYISYDFGFTLQPNHEKLFPQKIEYTQESDLPMVAMGLYQWALITDHKEQNTTLYNFGLNLNEWEDAQNFITTNIQKATDELAPHSKAKLTAPFKSNTDYKTYKNAFNKIQTYIREGDCYQVNFAQRFNSQFQGESFDLYRELAKENNSPFSAYINLGSQQILSLSPERFIQSDGKKVTTQPIKGTLPRSQDPVKDEKLAHQLKNSEKDRAENLMIVDLLRNDLSKTAAKGSVKVTELFGHYKFESVHHLISTIESELGDSFDNFDLLRTTLPGGSITGAPKIRAMQIIDELEANNRGIYCGIIGYIDFKGNMDTNICIRTLLADGEQLYCWAGGGLVSDSQLDSEYQETFDKLNKIIPVLHKLSGIDDSDE